MLCSPPFADVFVFVPRRGASRTDVSNWLPTQCCIGLICLMKFLLIGARNKPPSVVEKAPGIPEMRSMQEMQAKCDLIVWCPAYSLRVVDVDVDGCDNDGAYALAQP